MNKYDMVIGLEIHAQLNTKSKVFCSCSNSFGDDPNTNCCPVCVGMPGALPILNKEAVKSTIKAGLAVGCDINDVAVFERKNYFYPDLSKAYQVSQLVKPICLNGGLELESGKFVRLNRIHLEEDAGKLNHVAGSSLVDYNRGGVPLMEIVTEPDISSADEAIEFITKLRNTILYTEVAECKMQEGGMRCDVNLSLKEKGATEYGTRTEMKNLNSFKMIHKAIEFEAERQAEILDNGGKIKQETRKWDDEVEKSFSMRSKETSQDYRYFPDPDILAVKISREDVQKIKESMPLMPSELKDKFTNEFNLSDYDSNVLIKDRPMCSLFLECLKLFNNPKKITNWIMTNIMAKVKDEEDGIAKINAKQLTDIIKLVEERKISKQNAYILLDKLWATEDIAEQIAKKNKMINDINTDELNGILDKVLEENPQAINQYQEDKNKILNFLTGQSMKATRGKADPQYLRKYFTEKLEK